MNVLLLLALAVIFIGLGFTWGQVRLHDTTIKWLSPKVFEAAQEINRRKEELHPRERELNNRAATLIVKEYEQQAALKRAADAEKRLDAVLGDDNRKRVLWLSQQLAAHLSPHDVATMLTRDTKQLTAEMETSQQATT